MSCSKPLQPFVCDSLYYLNREQLERFSIVCRPLKNFINRYLHAKPYRVLEQLHIRDGLYALVHNYAQWHPNRDGYSIQQFLAGEECSIDEFKPTIGGIAYYSFEEMRPILCSTVRIKETSIYVAGGSIYNPERISEMESIAYLWSNGKIIIWNARSFGSRIVAEDFQPILNSPTILQCQTLSMTNAHFSFKDYKVLYTVKVIVTSYGYVRFDPSYWSKFLEEPGVKPLVVLSAARHEYINNILDRLCKAFSSAVLPNAFKMLFKFYGESLTIFAENGGPLTEFRETNKTSGEILELKKGLPDEYQESFEDEYNYTLARSSICL
ncbi:hypothetical protein Ddc_24876 [Ditylenchus destructor]|nr:hypothetical protein Ddc_24876 [Ditylenchus destructor]